MSVTVGPGQVLLLLGPSGSGKSTLALAIAGLVPADIPATVSGRLDLDGAAPGADADAAGVVGGRAGIVFQDPSSQLVMERVEDDVAFGLENRGWGHPAMRERVPQVLALAGLVGLERQRSRRLSGGQQQRLALAGALAPRPGLLVLDEPTANLDPAAADAFIEHLVRLREARSTTIVLIEHRVGLAWPLADVVLALDADGTVIDVGAPAEVLARSRATMDRAGIWLPDGEPRGPVRARAGPAATGPLVVATRDLRFGYERDRPVVRDVSLDIAAGDRLALVGPNGSGKSTLARLLVGLLRPDAGVVSLQGDDPARLRPAALARRAAYVFQDPERQFLRTTVRDEVLLGLRPAEHGRAADLMERLRLPLDAFGERSPYRLSGGEQRRLSLACGLVRDPAVMVLDEPTFGQDRLGYDGLLEILRERLATGAALVAATHDPRFVRDACERVIELDEGWIVPPVAAGSAP
ncbi:MAG: ABC transporter ATP-binding protein [Candidatus Limnocylindria bacterium]